MIIKLFILHSILRAVLINIIVTRWSNKLTDKPTAISTNPYPFKAKIPSKPDPFLILLSHSLEIWSRWSLTAKSCINWEINILFRRRMCIKSGRACPKYSEIPSTRLISNWISPITMLLHLAKQTRITRWRLGTPITRLSREFCSSRAGLSQEI